MRVRDEVRLTLPDEPAAHEIALLIDGVELAQDFATPAWRKLVINAVAGLMVLSGRRAGMFRRPDVRALARELALETLAVARAEGADLPDAVADELLDEFAGYPEDLGSSILFDREAGRALEWDARNGVVARLGAKHGIPTPVSDVDRPAAGGGEPGLAHQRAGTMRPMTGSRAYPTASQKAVASALVRRPRAR